MQLRLAVETIASSTRYARGAPIAVRVTLSNHATEPVRISEVWPAQLDIAFFAVGSQQPLFLRPPGLPPVGGLPTGTITIAPGASISADLKQVDFVLAEPLQPGEYRLEIAYSEVSWHHDCQLQARAQPALITIADDS